MSVLLLTHKNLRLSAGCHDFPKDTGHICVNEAAILFAGYKYRPVQIATNCPRCFSRVIASYAIGLNDYMPRAFRNRLLKPFVDKLPDTVAAAHIEKERSDFIALETGRRVISLLSDCLKREDFAQRCRDVSDLKALAKILEEMTTQTMPPAHTACSSLLTAINYLFRGTREAYAIHAPYEAAFAIASAATGDNARQVWTIGAHILDEAIRLSRRPRLLKDCRRNHSLPLAA